MRDIIKTFTWQSHGTTIEAHRNETLWLRVRWERERQAQARCDEENTQ